MTTSSARFLHGREHKFNRGGTLPPHNFNSMRYIDKVIKGEKNFKEFMSKFRPNCEVRWMETIGHCNDVTIEMFYEKGPEDDYYGQFYWLTMPSYDEKGFTDGQFSERRHQVHEGIRTGRISG